MAKIIILDAVKSQLTEIPINVLIKIRSNLSFIDKKSFYASKSSKGWRGNVDFMNKNGVFLTGLLSDVCAILTAMDIDYKVYRAKECTKPIALDELLITNELVKPRGMCLRDEQVEFVKRYFEHRRGIIHAATGFGKTAVMAAIVKLIPNDVPGLVVINSIDLIQQTYDEFIQFGISSDRIGMFNGVCKDPKTVTITTVNSLPNLAEMLPHIRFIIADEAHEKITSGSATPWWRKMKNATDRIAFSATPFKEGDQVHEHKLRGHFGPVLGIAKTKDLQDNGILSKANTYFHVMSYPNTQEDWEAAYKPAYDKYIVENEEFHDIAAKLIVSLKGRTVIFVERKDHGLELLKRIPNAIWISGDDKKALRKEVKEKLRTSPEDTPVISTKIFKTGLDIFVHNVVNLSAMASKHGTIQGFGRGLRLAPDKKYCDYHDFIFTQNLHLNRHSKKRMSALKSEGHKIEILDDLA